MINMILSRKTEEEYLNNSTNYNVSNTSRITKEEIMPKKKMLTESGLVLH